MAFRPNGTSNSHISKGGGWGWGFESPLGVWLTYQEKKMIVIGNKILKKIWKLLFDFDMSNWVGIYQTCLEAGSY